MEVTLTYIAIVVKLVNLLRLGWPGLNQLPDACCLPFAFDVAVKLLHLGWTGLNQLPDVCFLPFAFDVPVKSLHLGWTGLNQLPDACRLPIAQDHLCFCPLLVLHGMDFTGQSFPLFFPGTQQNCPLEVVHPLVVVAMRLLRARRR